MQKVLVVEDEKDLRSQLGLTLSAQGYDVVTTGSGRRAIHIGCRYRPDVLVADWMLKNQIHGLHVAQALAAVNPSMRTLIITGFASDHLRSEADAARVFEFIEKPFDLEQIQKSVREAVNREDAQAQHSGVAIAEVEGKQVTFANGRAREMFGHTHAGQDLSNFEALFAPNAAPDLDAATRGWLDVQPAADSEMHWQLRARQLGSENWLLVILAEDERYQKTRGVVGMLLGISKRPYLRWPFDGRVLLLDGEEFFRRVAVSQFQRIGCMCHAAESYEVALRLLERDADIDLLVVDYETGRSDLPERLRELREQRPSLRIVGTSHGDRRREFAEQRIPFLSKPWTVRELVNLMSQIDD